jgi:hypothetical protein
MRTTLTLEPDVAHALERLRKNKRLTLKQAVNQALRQGLRAPKKSGGPRKRFRTRAVDHGRPLVGNLDDIAGVLSVVEDEAFQ